MIDIACIRGWLEKPKCVCRICAVCAQVVCSICWNFFEQFSLNPNNTLPNHAPFYAFPPLCPSCHLSQIQTSHFLYDMPPVGTFEVFGTSPTDATSSAFGVLQTKPQNTSEAQTIQETAEVNAPPVSIFPPNTHTFHLYFWFDFQLLLVRIKVLTALFVCVGFAGKTSFGMGS